MEEDWMDIPSELLEKLFTTQDSIATEHDEFSEDDGELDDDDLDDHYGGDSDADQKDAQITAEDEHQGDRKVELHSPLNSCMFDEIDRLNYSHTVRDMLKMQLHISNRIFERHMRPVIAQSRKLCLVLHLVPSDTSLEHRIVVLLKAQSLARLYLLGLLSVDDGHSAHQLWLRVLALLNHRGLSRDHLNQHLIGVATEGNRPMIGRNSTLANQIHAHFPHVQVFYSADVLIGSVLLEVKRHCPPLDTFANSWNIARRAFHHRRSVVLRIHPDHASQWRRIGRIFDPRWIIFDLEAVETAWKQLSVILAEANDARVRSVDFVRNLALLRAIVDLMKKWVEPMDKSYCNLYLVEHSTWQLIEQLEQLACKPAQCELDDVDEVIRTQSFDFTIDTRGESLLLDRNELIHRIVQRLKLRLTFTQDQLIEKMSLLQMLFQDGQVDEKRLELAEKQLKMIINRDQLQLGQLSRQAWLLSEVWNTNSLTYWSVKEAVTETRLVLTHPDHASLPTGLQSATLVIRLMGPDHPCTECLQDWSHSWLTFYGRFPDLGIAKHIYQDGDSQTNKARHYRKMKHNQSKSSKVKNHNFKGNKASDCPLQ